MYVQVCSQKGQGQGQGRWQRWGLGGSPEPQHWEGGWFTWCVRVAVGASCSQTWCGLTLVLREESKKWGKRALGTQENEDF